MGFTPKRSRLIAGRHDKPFPAFICQEWADDLNVGHEAASCTGFHLAGRLRHELISKKNPPLIIISSPAELQSLPFPV